MRGLKSNQPLSSEAMIVVCPTCATRHDVPHSHLGRDGLMISCAACGHRWIESRALSVSEQPRDMAAAENDSYAVEDAIIEEREVMRLAQAARAAEAQLKAQRLRRRKELRGFAMLGGAILLPAIIAMVFPERVASAFPHMQLVYSMAGLKVNAMGLEFKNVGQQHRIVEGVRVLAIQGEIVNVGGGERSMPELLFVLKDARMTPVYQWRLTATTRPVKPQEVSTFVTRVASPPETARHVEIRFAPDGETGSNAGHADGKN
jgi:predicted Zn finger-like uncharacterized protein